MNNYKHVLDELRDRGYIEQFTNEEEIYKLLKNPGQKFYIGFDATADSLTIGHFIQIMVMMRMQNYGHHPIALVGGGTTMIGDPTGRSDMRKFQTDENINYNVNRFKQQLSKYLKIEEGKAVVVNNADWLLNQSFIGFMRDVGRYFNVAEMVKKDAYKNRMESGGLTFLEFSYMLLQSYDFLELYRRDGVCLEFGGSDQWANMIGGIELIRKVEGKEAYGMTFSLLTTADGVKMGKSMKGAIWLDENKTTPYELFQYMRNVDDRDVKKLLLQLTFLPTEECHILGDKKDQSINESKEILAYEVTKIIHGEEKAKKALEVSRSLFSNKTNHEDMPTIDVKIDGDSIGVLTLLTEAKITSSNGEARRLIQQGGISIDDQKVKDHTLTFSIEELQKGLVVKKGKKFVFKVICS